MGYLLAVAMGYLLGCSSMALYLSKLKKVDPRSGGSRNLGASNAMILMGWWAGVLVGLHDIGKSALAVFLAKWLLPNLEHADAVAGVACVVGHVFPFYLKFKGGKGFASYVGMMFAMSWKVGLVVGAAIVLVTIITDYLVLGTFTTITVVPVWMGLARHSFILALILLVGTAVIFYKHRENITRLRNGTEIGLRSAFTTAYGCSPLQYRMQSKISRAKYLLESTDLSVYDIAEQLRFYDEAYFCKMFRKYTGCSPKKYLQNKSI